MQKNFKLLLGLLFLLPLAAMSQNSMAGDWLYNYTDEDGSQIVLKMSFTDDSYSVDFGNKGSADVKGKYTMDGNQCTLWDVEGAYSCPSEQKGVYTIEINGDTLTATRVKDDCPGRGNTEKMVMQRAK